MKKVILAAAAVLAMLVLALPAGAAWEEKVTGGGQGHSGSIYFSITVSAWDGPAGQMEYSREGQSVPDLSMHATIECLKIASSNEEAFAAGPVRAQNDPDGLVDEGDWMILGIKEGGVGSGDTVRVQIEPQSSVDLNTCRVTNQSPVFPGLIHDGNFNIRTR